MQLHLGEITGLSCKEVLQLQILFMLMPIGVQLAMELKPGQALVLHFLMRLFLICLPAYLMALQRIFKAVAHSIILIIMFIRE